MLLSEHTHTVSRLCALCQNPLLWLFSFYSGTCILNGNALLNFLHLIFPGSQQRDRNPTLSQKEFILLDFILASKQDTNWKSTEVLGEKNGWTTSYHKSFCSFLNLAAVQGSNALKYRMPNRALQHTRKLREEELWTPLFRNQLDLWPHHFQVIPAINGPSW